MDRPQRIGIFGGSFNPIHIGHLMVASFMQQWGGLDEVWLTLSPLNPLKSHPLELIPDYHRLAMLHCATKGVAGVGVCDIELSMPRPSYTCNTMEVLSRRYPRKQFKLIIGSDNWAIFDKWKRWEWLLSTYGVIVYPRPGYPVDPDRQADGMELIKAPWFSISSSFVRSAIAKGRDMTCFLPPGVYSYIKDHNLYLPDTSNS